MTNWQHSSDLPVLEKNDVHIWRANLDIPATEIEKYSNYLSEDEIARANKFRFPQHRQRFMVARSILRQLLGIYLDICPKTIVFEYSDRGKPQLAKFNNGRQLQFNLSHSQGYALYGFTQNNFIGVDLEYLREMPDAVKIARRFFSPREFQFIASLDRERQTKVFFQLWTAKEAYLKAIGTGLAGSLAAVDITLDSAENVSLLAIDGDESSIEDWSLYSCVPASDCVATIAIKTQTGDRQLNFWDWNRI